MLGRWIDKTRLPRAVNQPVPAPALKQPTSIPNSAQMDTGPRPPPTGTTELEDERPVIENLPAVRVAARRIYRLLSDHVSFARIYSDGVMGVVGALDEFHASNLVRLADFAKRKIRDAILYSVPNLVWEAEEQRRKGKSVEAAIHELRAELDRSPTEVEISHELHLDLAAYRRLLGELNGIEIGSLHSHRLKGSFRRRHRRFRELARRWRTDTPSTCWPAGKTNGRNQKSAGTQASGPESLLPRRIDPERNWSRLDEPEARVSQIHASAILYLRSQLSNFGYS
jgi:RNA polymerase sigma factor for flagellar operon FliA